MHMNSARWLAEEKVVKLRKEDEERKRKKKKKKKKEKER